MIKFFRKIRHRLLSENKLSKYIIYSIGEILLVVIGILIALQINNWNENKSNQKYVTTYLNKIKQNITADLNQIDNLKSDRARAAILCDTALIYYKQKYFTNSELFKQGFLGVFIEKQFNQNATAFESLKSSGYMKSINNLDLEEYLNEYYILQDKLLFVENKLNNYTQQVEEKLSDNGFYIEYRDMFDPSNNEKVNFTYKSMSKYPNIESSFIRAKLFLQEILENYLSVILKGEEIINQIENGG